MSEADYREEHCEMLSSGDGTTDSYVSQLWLPAQDLNKIKAGKCPRRRLVDKPLAEAPLTADVCWRGVTSLCVDGHWSVTCVSVGDPTVLGT